MPDQGRRASGPSRRASGGSAAERPEPHERGVAGGPPRSDDGSGRADVRHPRTADGAAGTLRDLVTSVAALLAHGVARGEYADPEREARELVAALHDQPRFWAALHPEHAVTLETQRDALEAARRRVAGAPLAYAVRRANFRHLTLHVDERVLIPRPETEQLVEIALSLVGDRVGGVAVDVGTGSGAVALALASEGRFDRVIASDVSRDALDVAARNRDALASGVATPVELRHGSLLDPVPETGLRCVVSNPPYIAFHEAAALPPSVRDWEPSVALYSAGDGLSLTARLVRQAAERLDAGGVLALEVDARRAALVEELVGRDARFAEVRVTLDLFGRERFVTARRRAS